jgi:predicted DsbA family dithiol-disulfide isomerase
MGNEHVELHVDPLCPWCWLTATWLFEVEAVRPIEIATRLFSLAEVNRANTSHRAAHEAGENALRVMAAARRAGGEAAARAVYREMGDATHERGEGLGDTTLRAALTAAGLDPGLADEALADDSTRAEVLAEHTAAVERGIFGVPALSVDGGPAFFGPIIEKRITGEAAGRLWDVVAPALTETALFEIKRTRTGKPQVGRLRESVGATP